MNDIELRTHLILRKEKLIAQIRELQKQVDACDALIGTLPASAQTPLPLKVPQDSASLAEAVKQAVDAVPEEFSIKDIYRIVELKIPRERLPSRDSISAAFWKLAKDRGYFVVRKGSGRAPTVYTKSPTAQQVLNQKL